MVARLHFPTPEGWPSGRRRWSRKPVGLFGVPWVRIPLPPPTRGCCGCTPRRLLGAETVAWARLDFPSPPGSFRLAADRAVTGSLPDAEKVRIPLPPPTRGCCGCTPRRLLGAETVALGEARFPFTSRLVVAGCGQGSHRQLGDAEKVRIPLPPPTRGCCGCTPRRLLGAETVALGEARFPFTSRLVVAGCGQGSHGQRD